MDDSRLQQARYFKILQAQLDMAVAVYEQTKANPDASTEQIAEAKKHMNECLFAAIRVAYLL
jgi:hypothetical protein